MNPSTEEILEAIESIPYSDVIILPNNKNTIAACQMAKQLTKKRLEIRVQPSNLLSMNQHIEFKYPSKKIKDYRSMNLDDIESKITEIRSKII